MTAFEEGKSAYENGLGPEDWPKAYKVNVSKKMDWEAGWEEAHQSDVTHDFMDAFEEIFCD